VVDDDAAVTRSAAAERTARLLVRGPRDGHDEEFVARVVGLVDTEGIEEVAQLWSHAEPGTLAGCLWRLYLLRTWVHADPVRAAREFDDGRRLSPVSEAVAGVVDPPGPDEVRELADRVLRGVVEGDFADTLFRAAAFARVAAAGRARDATSVEDLDSAQRLATMAAQLDSAGHRELAGELD
jgi:hypothetical protein